MIVDAPAASAFTTSPEYLMPPSPITGTPARSATSDASRIAVNCGTPTPATTRVVQIEPGPTPTLTADTPALISASVPSAVATLPPISGRFGKCDLQRANRLEHTRRMAMGRVDHDDVDARVDQRLRALEVIRSDADRRPAAQPPEIVLAGVRVALGLLDVLDRDEAAELALVVDDEQLLDAVGVQQLLRAVHRRAGRDGHEVPARHHRRDLGRDVLHEAQVAVGQDADRLAVARDGHTRDPEAAHHLERFADLLLRAHRDRVDDHARLGALDLVDLGGLVGDREILVDDADAAVAGHADRGLVLGDGVHRRGDERRVEMDLGRQLRSEIDVSEGSTSEAAGTSSTSSNVSPSRISDWLIGDARLPGKSRA